MQTFPNKFIGSNGYDTQRVTEKLCIKSTINITTILFVITNKLENEQAGFLNTNAN